MATPTPPLSLQQTTAPVVNNAINANPNYQQSISFNSQSPEQAIDGNTNSIGAYSFPSDTPKYYMGFAFSQYQRPSIFSSLNLNLTNSIILPMPANLVDDTNVTYNIESLGAYGFAADSMAQGFNNRDSILNGSITDNLKSAGEKALGGAGTYGISALGGPLSQTLLQMAGIAENPFLTVALKNANFKKHQFKWRLAPSSAQESYTIAQMIKLFKAMALPDLTIGGSAFSYPYICVPAFYPSDDYLYTFKPCVIEDFTANFVTGSNPSFFAGTGAPTEVEFTLQLLEIELWLASNFSVT